MNTGKIGGHRRNLRKQKCEDRLPGGVRYNVGSFERIIWVGWCAVRLEPLYHVRVTFTRIWGAGLAGEDSPEGQFFGIGDGRCEGRISGRFRGANHPYRRGDGTFLPDLQGVIETDDGAEVLFDYRGYGRAYPEGRRQIVASGAHVSDDERYRWLNDSLSVGNGEVRPQEDGSTEVIIEWSELVWEPIAE